MATRKKARTYRSARKPSALSTTRPGGTKESRTKSTKGTVLVERLEEYVRAHAEGLMDDPNITSVGVGYKQVGGHPTEVLAIQFTVASKILPQGLTIAPTRPIPPTIKIGGVDVPTDVIERTYAPAYEIRPPKPKDSVRRRAQTLQPGMSVGGAETGGGSIGCFVKDRQANRMVLLSNWHVLHGPKGSLGNDVAQPGKHDDDRVSKNRIGELLRSHLGPAGDCAIASVGGRTISNKPVNIDHVVINAIGKPALKDRVVKSGRTTGVTYGRVSRIAVNTRMNYGGGISFVIGGFEDQSPTPTGRRRKTRCLAAEILALPGWPLTRTVSQPG